MRKKIITGYITILLIPIFLFIPGCDNFSLVDVLTSNISLIPGEITLNLDETIKFEVSSGIAPFEFTEVGNGEVLEGIYTAPSSTGDFTISVRDDRDRIAEAYVTVVDAVILSPAIISTGIGGILPFTIYGGTGPHTVALDPNLGNVGSLTYDAGTGISYFDYTAINVGFEVIQAMDSIGQITEAYVTISNDTVLMILPDIVEVVKTDVFAFSASGGTGSGTYIYSIISGGGSIDAGNGRYTAPGVEGTAVVRVTDATPDIAEATVIIVAELLTINPSVSITLYVGDEFTFSASYGTSPYVFSIMEGDESSGSINSSTGLFTALAKDNSATVIVTDANGNTSTCRVKIKS